MRITEVLVTGYDGEQAVIAVNLVSGAAKVVITSTDKNRETVVNLARQQAGDAFTAVRDVLDGLVGAPTRASS